MKSIPGKLHCATDTPAYMLAQKHSKEPQATKVPSENHAAHQRLRLWSTALLETPLPYAERWCRELQPKLDLEVKCVHSCLGLS